MTTVIFRKTRQGEYRELECRGHAGYADKGEDIVCAGISALVINTVNSLGRFTEEQFTVDASEEEGRIALRLKEPAGHDGGLLIKSLILGLEEIQHTYGNDYLVLDFREV